MSNGYNQGPVKHWLVFSLCVCVFVCVSGCSALLLPGSSIQQFGEYTQNKGQHENDRLYLCIYAFMYPSWNLSQTMVCISIDRYIDTWIHIHMCVCMCVLSQDNWYTYTRPSNKEAWHNAHTHTPIQNIHAQF